MAVSFGYSTPWLFGADPFGMTTLLALVLIASWVILAGSRFVQGGVVERPERVPQLYGYTLCLVGLLWGLTSLIGIVRNVQTLAAPEYYQQMEFGPEPSITSFEAFRLTYDRVRQFSSMNPAEVKLDSVPDAELRQRYETFRRDRIAQTAVQARQALVTKLISLLLAIALFAFHWRWLKRRVPALA